MDYEEKLKLMKLLEKEKFPFIPSRTFETYEYPELRTSKNIAWSLKTASKSEKLRYVAIDIQKERINDFENECKMLMYV